MDDKQDVPPNQDKNKETVTLKLFDNKTGKLIHTDEVDVSTVAKLHAIAEQLGIPFEEVVTRVLEDSLYELGKADGFFTVMTERYSDDPTIRMKFRRMLDETYREAIQPGWKLPEGLILEEGMPPYVKAYFTVIVRLHMAGHEN